MNRLVGTGKPQHSRLIFPPYTKHFFNVLLFSRAIVRLYLPNDGGANQLQMECNQLQEGANQLQNECNQLQEGANQVQQEGNELQEGANKLQKEGNQLQEGANQVEKECNLPPVPGYTPALTG